MGKANISFPEGMLEEIEHRAEKTGTTRSGFVQEAVAAYLTELDRRAEADERSKRVSRALEGMRAIGERLPAGPTGVEMLRRMRESGPRWESPEGAGR